MPYSLYRVPNRKAVCSLRYDVRKFLQRAEPTMNAEHFERLKQRLEEVVEFAGSSADYDDDGSELTPQVTL